MADESEPAEGGIVSDKFLADNAAALRDAATEVTLPINFLPAAAQGAWQVGPNSISVQANPDLAKAAASISAMIQVGISGGAAGQLSYAFAGPTQTFSIPAVRPPNPLMEPFVSTMLRIRTGAKELMHDFWGVNQGVAKNDVLFTPLFGICVTSPANAQSNANRAVPVGDMVKKYKLDVDLIRAGSRLMAGLMVGHVDTHVGAQQALDAPADNPILEAISAVATKNIPYEGAHPQMYEAAKEAIEDVINTACGNDLGKRAKMRDNLANGRDPKLLGHLVKAILGELVAYAVAAEYAVATLTCSSRGMPISVEHALDDLTLAMLEGHGRMLSAANDWHAPAWGGPIACLIPNKGELNTIGGGVVKVPAFELYPLCMKIAELSGASFYGVQESLALDPIAVLSSAAAICGCSFGVIWPAFYAGGQNYGAAAAADFFSNDFAGIRSGRIVVAREVHSQAVAKGLSCVSHDWAHMAKIVDVRAEKDVITLLGNAVCGQTDLMLHNADTGEMRHGHSLDTNLLKGKFSIGMPPSCGWTGVGRSGMLGSARWQYESVYLKHSLESTMLETRKHYKLAKA